MLLGLALGFALLPAARATPPAPVQAEVNQLLESIATSGCEFFRNGSWHDAKQAQLHLRYKYEALAARNQIGTAEDFIEKAATRSSLSGRPYAIRCGDGIIVTTNQWLRDELARLRSQGTIGAPRISRGAPGIEPNGLRSSLSRPSSP